MAIVTELRDKKDNVVEFAAKQFVEEKQIVLAGDITGNTLWNAASGMNIEVSINSNTIGTNELQNSAVTTSKISNGAVTLNKLADGVTAYIDTAESNALASAKTYTDEQIETVIADAKYDSDTKEIVFLNTEGTKVTSINATAFIKDGMVDSVIVKDGNLVISFNTDADKVAISIPIRDIFDATDYYTKTKVDTELAKKLDKTVASTTYATTGSLNTEISERKADKTTLQKNIDDTNDRIDTLETTVGNVKTKQSAVNDPAASGNAVTFIDTISQNANGEISVTKKNVELTATYDAAKTCLRFDNITFV